MKILLINKFHYKKGGSETYYFALADALKAKGHEVVFFAMQDDKNIPCKQAEFFVKNVNYNQSAGFKSKLSALKSFFYSKEAKQRMEALIEKENPDIAHIGLLHRQLTFSVVDALKEHNIPVVMTMHDLIFACPNYTMLTHSHICEKCLYGASFPCIQNRCVKNSLLKSVLASLEKRYLYRHKYYDKIDLYIAECQKYARLMKQSGFTKSKIICMTNFLPIEQKYGNNNNYEDYILYFGRFSEEKGLKTLLEAHKELKCRYKLKLVGDGPIASDLEKHAKENELINCEFTGAIYGDEMDKILELAKVVVVPSEWYENCPYALLQSLAKGKIAIVSNIGGLPELIEDNKTGFLFEAGNYIDLASKINQVMQMKDDEIIKMSEVIAGEAKAKHHWERYIDSLIGQYMGLLKMKSC